MMIMMNLYLAEREEKEEWLSQAKPVAKPLDIFMWIILYSSCRE